MPRTDKQNARYASRKAAGLCTQCAQPAMQKQLKGGGFKTLISCASCRSKMDANMAALRGKRRMDGGCADCGGMRAQNAAGHELSRCAEHHERRLKSQREIADKLRAALQRAVLERLPASRLSLLPTSDQLEQLVAFVPGLEGLQAAYVWEGIESGMEALFNAIKSGSSGLADMFRSTDRFEPLTQLFLHGDAILRYPDGARVARKDLADAVLAGHITFFTVHQAHGDMAKAEGLVVETRMIKALWGALPNGVFNVNTINELLVRCRPGVHNHCRVGITFLSLAWIEAMGLRVFGGPRRMSTPIAMAINS